METAGEDDLKLLRASTSHLSDLEKLILRLTRRRDHNSNKPSPQVRVVDLWRIQGLVRLRCTRIEPHS